MKRDFPFLTARVRRRLGFHVYSKIVLSGEKLMHLNIMMTFVLRIKMCWFKFLTIFQCVFIFCKMN